MRRRYGPLMDLRGRLPDLAHGQISTVTRQPLAAGRGAGAARRCAAVLGAVLLTSGTAQSQVTCRVAKLTALDGAPFDTLGYWVATRPGSIFVGAEGHVDGSGHFGAVYVYTVDGTTRTLA